MKTHREKKKSTLRQNFPDFRYLKVILCLILLVVTMTNKAKAGGYTPGNGHGRQTVSKTKSKKGMVYREWVTQDGIKILIQTPIGTGGQSNDPPTDPPGGGNGGGTGSGTGG